MWKLKVLMLDQISLRINMNFEAGNFSCDVVFYYKRNRMKWKAVSCKKEGGHERALPTLLSKCISMVDGEY